MRITPGYNNRINSDWQFRCTPLPAGYDEGKIDTLTSPVRTESNGRV